LRPPGGAVDIAGFLLAQWPGYVAYVISFLLIGLVWANHHTMFERIGRGDRVLLFLNTLLLMDVAFMPFVASVLADAIRAGRGLTPAVVAYGSTLVVGGIFFNLVWEWARRRPGLLADRVNRGEVGRIALGFWAGPTCYLVGTLLGLVVPSAAIAIFAALILIYWLPVWELRRHHS
ncbi:MAG: DUF1211 domain-containing protein, partial [Candidatus Dormibacteraeota bacterium]|nr:DUF1211 domain-containing protein [Candidatus Dormibacteraeota bacterium]